MKICKKCGKDNASFYKDKNAADGYRTICKTCDIQRRISFAKENPEQTKIAKKKYTAKHKDKLKQANELLKQNNPKYFANKAKQYRERNKDVVLSRRRQQDKERRKNDPLYKIRRATSSNITLAITKRGYKKNSKTEFILGCNWLIFKLHIESLFKPGMTWDNYGEWQIDHIKPCLAAKDETELLKLQHYLNLQPIWKQFHFEKTKNDLRLK